MAEPATLPRRDGLQTGLLPAGGRRASGRAPWRLYGRALSLLVIAIGASTCNAPQSPEAPRLVVVIVVDQLRPDLLVRYDKCFTGGFRRLLDRGHYYTSAIHDHAATNTAPGHATLGTGLVPAHHGIVDNTWYETAGDSAVAVPCVADSTMPILGGTGEDGVSPRHLQATTLADWLRGADPASQVVSLGGKDRSSVLLAGAGRGDVYWFSRNEERFVTSVWYCDAYPAWLESFHATEWRRFTADSTWSCVVPPAQRSLARGAASFQHDFSGSERSFWSWWARTPYLDAATLALGREAVRALVLGGDASPDLLALALSQTDILGHEFGPLSLEQLDNLMRLDRTLGEFFAFLDAQVGAEKWLVGLSADHGVRDTAVHQREDGVDVRVLARSEVDSVLALLQELDGDAGDPGAQRRVEARLEAVPFVADAMTHAELARAQSQAERGKAQSGAERAEALPKGERGASVPPRDLSAQAAADSFGGFFRNSYFPGRWPSWPLGSSRRRQTPGLFGVEARLQPWVTRSAAEAEHGSPYWVDRHVPMVFMGPGIVAGTTGSPVRTVDFAPTLARLAGLPVPAGLDGRALDP